MASPLFGTRVTCTRINHCSRLQARGNPGIEIDSEKGQSKANTGRQCAKSMPDHSHARGANGSAPPKQSLVTPFSMINGEEAG